MFKSTATFGAKREVDSSWNDDTSATYTSVSPAATRAMQASPMLPTACAARPASSSRWAAIDVVVVLPFVPVMATHVLDSSDSRHANSTSLTNSALAAFADWKNSEISGMPGLAMHKSNEPPTACARGATASFPNSTAAPAAFARSASARAVCVSPPAATASASTRVPKSGSR